MLYDGVTNNEDEGDENYPPLHMAAQNGNVSLIDQLVSEGANLYEKDSGGRTVLFYAKDKETIDCLIEHGAETYDFDNQDIELIEYMRQSSRSPSFIKHIQNRIGFNKETLENFYQTIKSFLKEELLTAERQEKQLLIILGETHNHYPTYQVKKVIYKVASELGIKTSFVEYDQQKTKRFLKIKSSQCTTHATKAIKYSQTKLGMSIEGIDSLHDIENSTSDEGMRLRNIAMKEEFLKKTPKSCLITIGALHFKGLLEDEISRITRKKEYYLLPFNLERLISDKPNAFGTTEDALCGQLGFNPDKIIQVIPPSSFSSNITLSHPKKVIAYWNSVDKLDSKESAEYTHLTRVAQDEIENGAHKKRKKPPTSSQKEVDIPLSKSLRLETPQTLPLALLAHAPVLFSGKNPQKKKNKTTTNIASKSVSPKTVGSEKNASGWPSF